MSFVASNIDTYRRFDSYEELKRELEIPSFQRTLDEDSVNQIVNYITESILMGKCIALGAIDLCKIESLPHLYLIDGQHRYMAIKKLYETRNMKIPINAIIYNVKTFEEMRDLFKIRNLGTKVPFYYFEHNINDNMELLKNMEYHLTTIPVFKAGIVNRPYASRTAFLKVFMTSKFYTENHIKSLDDFDYILQGLNNFCKEDVETPSIVKKFSISERMLNTWKSLDWYLTYDHNFSYLFNSEKVRMTLALLNGLNNIDY